MTTVPVQLDVSAITLEDGVLMTVTNVVTLEVLAVNQTLQDVLDNPEWRVTSAVHPLTVPEMDLPVRKTLNDLKAMRKQLSDNRDEQSSCVGRARYEALQAEERVIERRLVAQRMATNVTFKAATGMWAHEVRNLGV